MKTRLVMWLVLILGCLSTSFAGQSREVAILNAPDAQAGSPTQADGFNWTAIGPTTRIWHNLPMTVAGTNGSELRGALDLAGLPPGAYQVTARGFNQWGEGPASETATLAIAAEPVSSCSAPPRFVFAEGFVWRSPLKPTQTILTLTNASAEAQLVRATFALQAGAPIVKTMNVPAMSRREMDLNFTFTSGSTYFASVVEFERSGSASLVMWLGGKPNGIPHTSVPVVETCR